MSQVQGSNLLDVLKKKMRQTKEEMERYKEESEDMARKLQVEISRREEVSFLSHDTRKPVDCKLNYQPMQLSSLPVIDI